MHSKTPTPRRSGSFPLLWSPPDEPRLSLGDANKSSALYTTMATQVHPWSSPTNGQPDETTVKPTTAGVDPPSPTAVTTAERMILLLIARGERLEKLLLARIDALEKRLRHVDVALEQTTTRQQLEQSLTTLQPTHAQQQCIKSLQHHTRLLSVF